MTARMSFGALILGACLIVVGCQTSSPKPDQTDTMATSEKGVDWTGEQRLGDEVVPTQYTLELTIDPNKERFEGRVEIALNIVQPLRFIRMHADALEIETVALKREGEKAIKGAATLTDKGGLLVELENTASEGAATLHIVYAAPLPKTTAGLYRVEEGGDWYAFTQFEPLAARKAFPSFDEPRFKTPYHTTLRIPEGLVGASNSLLKSKSNDNGMVRLTFEKTQPLPTYLVAFAVGPFDVVEAPKQAIPSVPFRILAPRGKGKMAKYALERTPPIVASLTRYFGRPFPFAKLDMVAVPNFAAGAMENVGLVTYRETLLLVDEESASASQRYRSQSVIAHELAHMWFGNQVTMAWWDDLWLNEAFATWMATRVLTDVAPDLESDLSAVVSAGRVMGGDALKNARAIRQPILKEGDIHNAFDGITYSKGQAVLRMFEAWMGKDVFQSAVQAYMEKHAYKNATTADLMAAFEAASGKEVSKTMATFLDQPGTPLVEITSSCADAGPLTLSVRQTRYLPAGSDAGKGTPWAIPMCLRLGAADGSSTRKCFLFDQEEGVVALPVKRCPVWIHPNADEAGYYHWLLPPKQMVALARDHREALSLPERVGLLSHLDALVESHHLKARDHLSALEAMSGERHRLIVRRLAGTLGTVGQDLVETEADRKALAAVAQAWLGPWLKEVGFRPKKGEAVEIGLLRPSVVNTLALYGQDPAIKTEAEAIFKAYLSDPASVSAATLSIVIPIVAREGDQALWDRLKVLFEKERNPAIRKALLRGLGAMRTPKLFKDSMDLLLTDAVRSQDMWSITGPGMNNAITRPIVWSWLGQHYPELRAKLGDKRAGGLVWLGSGFCSAKRHDEVKAFFDEPSRNAPGLERNLSKVLEYISRCERYVDYVQSDVSAWLQAYKAKK